MFGFVGLPHKPTHATPPARLIYGRARRGTPQNPAPGHARLALLTAGAHQTDKRCGKTQIGRAAPLSGNLPISLEGTFGVPAFRGPQNHQGRADVTVLCQEQVEFPLLATCPQRCGRWCAGGMLCNTTDVTPAEACGMPACQIAHLLLKYMGGHNPSPKFPHFPTTARVRCQETHRARACREHECHQNGMFRANIHGPGGPMGIGDHKGVIENH